MKALKFDGLWALNMREVPRPTLMAEDDVLVDIEVCGICGTDIGILSGAYPVAIPGTTLGHETTGIVAEVGAAVTHVSPGDRVVINPTYSCGDCRRCKAGNPNHCERKQGTEAGVSYDGAFAACYRAKADALIPLDAHVSFEAASLTEPLSCVVTGVDSLHITHPAEQRAVVIGAGPMGLLYLWTLYHRGVRPCLIERQPQRLTFARSVIPEGTALYTSLEEALLAEYGDVQAEIDLAVDTSGMLASPLFDGLAPGGTLMNVALKQGSAEFDVLKIADKSLTVCGSIDSLNDSFARAYGLIRDGHVPTDRLVSHVYDFEDYVDAFATLGCMLSDGHLSAPAAPNGKVLIRAPR